MPLVVFIVWIGLRPNDFLPALDSQVRSVVKSSEAAMERRHAASEPVARVDELKQNTVGSEEAIARVR